MEIILGSKSQARRQILTQMGYEFSVMDPDIDEKSIRHQDPQKLVLAIAYAKAAALLPKIKKPSLLITADQVVYCNQKILEKPRNHEEAKEFLHMYATYPATTITALVVTNTVNKKQESGVDIATIWFQPMPDDVIEKIVAQECVLSYAGGFSLDSPLINSYLLKIDGTRESIAGLPKELMANLIQKIK